MLDFNICKYVPLSDRPYYLLDLNLLVSVYHYLMNCNICYILRTGVCASVYVIALCYVYLRNYVLYVVFICLLR